MSGITLFELSWRHRDGSRSTLSWVPSEGEEFIQDLSACCRQARVLGYPDHSGSPWQYFKADLKNLFTR